MSTCRSCDAPIIWALTTKKRRMPLDAEPNPAGNVELVPAGFGILPTAIVHQQPPMNPEHPIHMPHHATCPNADEWRPARRR